MSSNIWKANIISSFSGSYWTWCIVKKMGSFKDCWGLKKKIVGFWLPTDPCRCLRLIKFYSCQKYKIKFCRQSTIERLGYVQQKYLQSLYKKTCPFIGSGKLGDRHVLLVCLFGIANPVGRSVVSHISPAKSDWKTLWLDFDAMKIIQRKI